MRRHSRPCIESVCAFLAVCLVPRAALAHGEEILTYLLWSAWVVAVIPWAVLVYLVARFNVDPEIRRNRLGPLTVMTTVVAVGVGAGILVLTTTARPQPMALGPLLLVISAAPGIWFLWRQRSYDWLIAVVIVPVIVTGTGVAIWWSSR